jgi:cytochrome c peroxidase
MAGPIFWKTLRVCALTLAAGSGLRDPGWAQPQSARLPQDTLPSRWDYTALPLGLSEPVEHPADNQPTAAKIELGRRLFFDPVLSRDGSQSCASCHRPENNFASSDPIAVGVAGRKGERHAPTVMNRGWSRHLFWDGRAGSLEEQALQPITNPAELATTVEAVLEKLRSDHTYLQQFASAFPGSVAPARGEIENAAVVTPENLAKALACFERTLVAADAPVDRFRAGRYESLNQRQRTGMWIFESRGKCWQCHSGDNLTDEQFHNTGVGYGRAERDLGRFHVTQDPRDRFAMKTPTLRGVAQTAPYMHDGSIATLREVVEFYNEGGSPDDPDRDERIQPLRLSDEEVAALAEFLEALSPSEPFSQ